MSANGLPPIVIIPAAAHRRVALIVAERDALKAELNAQPPRYCAYCGSRVCECGLEDYQ